MSQKNTAAEHWDSVIESKHSLFDINLKELWHYRDLLVLFVRRDFVTVYKQTILGPLWFFIQPLLTTITFTIIFGNVAQLSTDGAPKIIFYMAGITLWNYFSTCLTTVSGVFNANASIFGKVYFPRVIMPMATVITNLIKLGIQLIIFVAFYVYYFANGMESALSFNLIFFPFLVKVNLNNSMSFSVKNSLIIEFSNNSSSNCSFNSPSLDVEVLPPDNLIKSLNAPSNFRVKESIAKIKLLILLV